MAKFEIRGLDDMMQALNALEVEEVAAKMLEESVPILEQEVKHFPDCGYGDKRWKTCWKEGAGKKYGKNGISRIRNFKAKSHAGIKQSHKKG